MFQLVVIHQIIFNRMEKATIELNESGKDSGATPVGWLENIAFIILLSVLFLLPIFFIPSASFPFQFSKMFLLSLFVLVPFACWILARLKDGKFVLPATVIIIAAAGTLLAAMISGLFSGAVGWSFSGQFLDLGTVGSMAVLFLLMFLVPIVFCSKDRVFYAYIVFFSAFFLIAVFQILRLIFGADFLSFGIFTDMTSNTLGKWNDLGIFFGIGAVLSLITIELISLSRFFKILSYTALVVSLFFLALVNFTPVWYILGIFSLIFLVYVISFDKSEGAAALSSVSSLDEEPAVSSGLRKVPLTSLVILVISLVFILGGDQIGSALANKLNITQIEARPSWAATLAVAKSVMANNPLLGGGPDRFAEKWVLYKPDGINSTVFWNTDFSFGVGFIPTFLITTGLLGALAWIIFLGLFLFIGFKAALSSTTDKVSRYLVSSSFLVSLFLWIINIVYIPGLTLVAMTFFFTGLFIASVYQSGIIRPKIISFVEDPRKGFVSVLTLILLLIGTIAAGYSSVEKFIASVYFQKGVVIFNNEGNVDKAEQYILKAAALDTSAAYYRSLVQIDMIRMSALISQSSNGVSADTIRTRFRNFLSAALNHAQQAVSIDQADYQNWISLGQVYEAVVPLKISNAYESASSAYLQALSLNPKSPSLLLTLARLEMSHGDNAKAKNYIARALQQKNNYTDAIFLLAQIQVAEGNIKDAISSVEAASYLAPNDSGTFFQLGLLRYSNKDFAGAAGALERAIALNPQYANAKYFLGLSYQRLGRIAPAIAQFNDLKATNPDNKEVALILRNLNAGLDPFANAAPPIDTHPEKRAKPPVSEKPSVKKKGAKTSPVIPDAVTPVDTTDTSL